MLLFSFFLSFFYALFKAWSSDCSIHLLKVFFSPEIAE